MLTTEQKELRRGKFTSSRITDLMGVKGLGKTGETYAFELAVEIAEGIDLEEGFTSYDIMRGNELEPIAFNKFKEIKALDFLEVTKTDIIALDSNTSSTPDGLVSDYGILEIKCPKPNKFFRLVADGEIDKGYLDQMQHQLFVTGRQVAYFFNYLIYNGEEKWHCIEIKRDDKYIDLMKERIAEAVIIRDAFVDQIISKRQYKAAKDTIAISFK
jgi:predicted phage-related endonuclease